MTELHAIQGSGYMGYFLFVDLTRRTCRKIEVPEWLKTSYIGGKGFGAKLLYDLAPEGCDPLGPENPLMFMTGPLTSTAAPSMRGVVVTKSPLTGLFLDSYFGGRFGPEIKYAGFDGIIITGVADEPVYLWINDGQASIRSAKALWGLDSIDTAGAVKRDLKAPDCRVAAIGPAGEKQVLYALINCEPNRQAGRGGAGAVMGSKNLKAVAVYGSRIVRVHDLPAFSQACEAAHDDINNSEDCRALTHSGTSYAVPWSNEVGLLTYKNYQGQSYDKADKLGDEGQGKHIFLGKAACFGCPIRCSQMGAVRTGKYAHIVSDTVEYESAALLGSNLLIHDIRAVAHLVLLCDKLGMDSMSTGNVVGFVFEAVERGAITPPKDVDLCFGSAKGAEYLIRIIAERKGKLGRILSQGVKKASEIIGKNSSDYAQHVKGLESPAWGPRGTPGMGLAYMTADRGACHQRGFMVAYEAGGAEYNGKPVDPYAVSGKAEILIGDQNYLAGTDTLVKCDFGAFGVSAENYASLLSNAVGKVYNASVFNEVGEKIWNLTRRFNLREGMTAEDDRLPKRFVEEVLPEGPHKGQRIGYRDMEIMKKEYYRERGWTEEGVPREETLSRLGLIDEDTFNLNTLKQTILE